MGFDGISSLTVSFIICALLLISTYPSTAVAEPRVQVSTDSANPIAEDSTAIIKCQIWDIPAGDIVVIEFERPGRRPEILLENGRFDDGVGDNFYTHQQEGSDGSIIRTLTITYLHRLDAGIYRCKVGLQDANGQLSITVSGEVYLDILHFPSEIYPTCHIVGFDKGLRRLVGSDVSLGCTTEFGSPKVSLKWTRTGDGYLPPAEEISNGALYSEIQVTLSQADNGIAFTCTASIPDSNESYSSSCLIGPFSVVTSGGAQPPTLPPAPPTTKVPPTPEPNTAVMISAPGTPFQEDDIAIVKCQIWELASNYIVSIVRMTTSDGTETLVYNGALLGHLSSQFQFEMSSPQTDGSVIFTLTINRVHRSDSGTYSCSVYKPSGENTFDIEVSDGTILDVINRPITERPVAATVSLTIPSPVDAGNRAYVQCLVTDLIGGDDLVISIESDTTAGIGTLAHDGQLSVAASRQGNILLVVQDDSVLDGTISYFMNINTVRQVDTGTYTCIARRSSGSEAVIASDSKDLRVTASTQPIDPSLTQPPDVNPITLPVDTRVTFSAQEDLVLEDDQAVLVCQIWGLEADQVVNIERVTPRGTELVVENNNLKNSVRDYVFLTLRPQSDGSVIYYLTLRFVAASESGTYTCYAKQSLGTSSYLVVASDTYYLNVVIPTPPPPTPPPRATYPPTGTRAIVTISADPAPERSTVYFQCQIHELFPNHVVSIERSTARGSETLVYDNEIPFSVADNFFVSILPQTDGSTIYYLIIRDIHRSDTGTYSCSIYDSFGSVSMTIVSMSSLELDVAYLPEQIHPECKIMTSERSTSTSLKYREGDDVNMVCSSGLGKPRVGVHWSSDRDTNDTTEERGTFKIVEDKVYSELSIQLSKKRHNDAIFTCVITSAAYEDTGRTCTIGPLTVSRASSLGIGGLGLCLFISIIVVLNSML